MTYTVRAIAAAAIAATLVVLGSSPAVAQKQTATEFYTAYRAAFDKATSVDELLPFMSTKQAAEVKATPAADRAMMFDMMKTMGALTNVKVVKETATATGATLDVEGLDPDKKKTTGVITLVKEGGAWKLDKESWKS